MAEHIFKRKSDGTEHLFDSSFKSPDFDDLGEGFVERDPVTGINYLKLVSEVGADASDQKPAATKVKKGAKGAKTAKPAENEEVEEDEESGEDTPPTE